MIRGVEYSSCRVGRGVVITSSHIMAVLALLVVRIRARTRARTRHIERDHRAGAQVIHLSDALLARERIHATILLARHGADRI